MSPIIIPDNLEDHMILIPAGSCERGEGKSRYLVSQAIWKAVMGHNPTYFSDPLHPVEKVSWEDCGQFLERLNEQSEYTYRLST